MKCPRPLGYAGRFFSGNSHGENAADSRRKRVGHGRKGCDERCRHTARTRHIRQKGGTVSQKDTARSV